MRRLVTFRRGAAKAAPHAEPSDTDRALDIHSWLEADTLWRERVKVIIRTLAAATSAALMLLEVWGNWAGTIEPFLRDPRFVYADTRSPSPAAFQWTLSMDSVPIVAVALSLVAAVLIAVAVSPPPVSNKVLDLYVRYRWSHASAWIATGAAAFALAVSLATLPRLSGFALTVLSAAGCGFASVTLQHVNDRDGVPIDEIRLHRLRVLIHALESKGFTAARLDLKRLTASIIVSVLPVLCWWFLSPLVNSVDSALQRANR